MRQVKLRECNLACLKWDVDIMSQSYYETVLKDLLRVNKDFERKYDQNIKNIEATQRIIIEKVGGIRSLVELNYKEMLKNRNEILENRKLILNGIEDLKEMLTSLEEKIVNK